MADLDVTRVIGWAAALTSNLRQQEVEDLDALRKVAAQTMGIESSAFKDVLRTIQETELGSVQERRGGKRVLFVSDVAHSTMYDRLGEQWTRASPSELDRAMVQSLDAIATTPRRETTLRHQLGLDAPTQDLVLTLGRSAQLIRDIKDDAGERYLYTPFYAFENADAIVSVLQGANDDEVNAAFAAVRAHQGLTVDKLQPVLQAAVAAGLIAAPTIHGVNGARSFAVLPFSVPPDLRVVKKAVLDKAQAIIAAVRYGQHHGRSYQIFDPVLVLKKLVDANRGRRLNRHPEHAAQYSVLEQLHIVRLVPSGTMFEVELIDTEDNVEAVRIAIDLITFGELVDQRMTDRTDVQALVASSHDYRHPLYTIGQQRARVPLPDAIVHKMLESIQGGSPIV